MKDKWMNLGCEDDELKPYVEPEQDFKEPKRIGVFLSYILLEVTFCLLTIHLNTKCYLFNMTTCLLRA